jgi:hypothetical protein
MKYQLGFDAVFGTNRRPVACPARKGSGKEDRAPDPGGHERGFLGTGWGLVWCRHLTLQLTDTCPVIFGPTIYCRLLRSERRCTRVDIAAALHLPLGVSRVGAKEREEGGGGGEECVGRR